MAWNPHIVYCDDLPLTCWLAISHDRGSLPSVSCWQPYVPELVLMPAAMHLCHDVPGWVANWHASGMLLMKLQVDLSTLQCDRHELQFTIAAKATMKGSGILACSA